MSRWCDPGVTPSACIGLQDGPKLFVAKLFFFFFQLLSIDWEKNSIVKSPSLSPLPPHVIVL